MKYVFPFLLLFFTSYSQTKPADLTSVEILHCFNSMHAGCEEFREKKIYDSQFLDSNGLIRYFSKDEKTVKKLYEIYINGKKNWKKKKREKYNNYYGDGNIPNMIVITYNSFHDTIYTTKENKSFYYKDGDFEYIDEGNHFINAFDTSIKKFYERDFKSEVKKSRSIKNDSINVSSLKLNKKNIYGLTKEEFEKEIYPINHITTQSEKIGKQDWQSFTAYFFEYENFIGFENENKSVSSLYIENGETTINIDNKSIQLGDSYEKISHYFKNSSAKIALDANPFDAKNSKYLEIDFINMPGHLFLTFENGKLATIDIDYKTPRY